jgi:Uma2 family endonuclease
MQDLLEPLLHSPHLPDYARRIDKYLREEAQRRSKFYEEVTDEGKWEFIEGEVIMHSPALNRHLHAVKHLTQLIDLYVRLHQLGVVHTEKCMCKFPRNDYEPDIVFFGLEKAATFTGATLLFPPPDLAVEVLSDSTAHRDRGVKFQDYEAHVKEYWLVDAEEEVVEQYVQSPTGYQLKMKSGTGVLESAVIDGLSIPVRAIFDAGVNFEQLRSMVG